MKQRNVGLIQKLCFDKLCRRLGIAIAVFWGLFPFFSSPVFAKDTYPSQRITWISHTKPGSGYDIIPRAMAPYLTKYLREQVPGAKGGDIVVKNETAAAGIKAYTMIYRAEPDGYTIGGIDISFITDMVMGKVDLDITKYTYLARLDASRKVIVTGKNGFKSWREAMDAAKVAPLKVAVGQFGRANHIAGILLKEALGFNAKFIATSSTAENMAMVIRGDAQVGVASEDSIANLIAAKEVRVLLTYDESHDYPGAVSLPALGHPQLGAYAAGQRFAIGPPGLPPEITQLLINALKKTMADSEFQAWAKKAKFSFDPIYGEEAFKLAKDYIKFYEGMVPTLQKYLK